MRPNFFLRLALLLIGFISIGPTSFAVESHASDIEFGGRVFTNHYYRIHPANERWMQNSLSTWIDLGASQLIPVSDSHSIYFQSTSLGTVFLKSLEVPGKATGRLTIREAYLGFQSESIEAKVGQLVIPWGKSDGVNPTDYFTSKNFNFLNPDEEVRRIGAFSALLNVTPKQGNSPITFTFVVQGRNPETRLLIPESAVPSQVQFIRNPEFGPIIAADSIQFGFKMAVLKSSYDFSISAFRGFASMPQFEFDGAKVFSRFSRQTSLGVDASFTYRSSIIRFESAFHVPDDGHSEHSLRGLVQPWRVDSVLGVERPLFGDWRGQIQMLHRYHFNYLNPNSITHLNPIIQSIQQSVGQANALILNFQDQQFFGATFRVSYMPDNPLVTGDLFLVGYLFGQDFANRGDYLLRPQINYLPIENWKFTLGAEIYGGDRDKTLGAMRDFSSVFLEGKWNF